ncbi:MAG: uroporphyrinogen decarboxylase family protein [Candidatus Humimicrobiaceae bacterium]
MNSRERVLITIDHKKPDRVPIYAGFVPQLERKLEECFKLKGPELDIELGNDMLLSFVGMSTGFYLKDTETYQDEWGITWKWIDIYTEHYIHPLSDDEAVLSFQTPDPLREDRYEEVRQIISSYGKDFAIMGCVPCTIFEAAWYLRGFDRVLLDFYENKDLINILLDKTMNFHMQAGLKLIEEGVDIIWVGDDFGSQEGMIISPDTWREFFKERYATIFSNFKKKNPNIKIAYHSDGNIIPIIPELIEIGLDILNPVQPLAMNPAELKKKFGKNLSFWGGVDIQFVLPFGTKKEIEDEVRLRMSQLNGNGGLILSPSHNVQCDTSVENVLTFYEAAKRYGKR